VTPLTSEQFDPQDPHDLYELCVQHPELDARLLHAIHAQDEHARTARVLGEDFSGTAALCRAWLAADPGRLALAIDHDRAVLTRANERARSRGVADRLSTIHRDLLRPAPDAHSTPRADIVFVGNFSIGEIHAREQLVEYLQSVRSRLTPSGIFACDLYGGVDAHRLGTFELELRAPDGRRVEYAWEQIAIDPTTATVVNAMHFSVERDTGSGGAMDELANAFEYRWRLWSITELRDAMGDAGFARTEVFDRFEHAEDETGRAHVRPIHDGTAMDDSYLVVVVGRQ